MDPIEEPLIATHHDIQNCMNALNYPINEHGTCFGITLMALQAVLAEGHVNTFKRRLELLSVLIEPVGLNIGTGTGTSLISAIKPLIEQEITRLLQKRKTTLLSEDEQIKLELYAFFDGVGIYQDPMSYPELFPTSDKVQNAQTSFLLASPQKLKNESGLIKIDAFSGAYTEEELCTYFITLQNAFQDTKEPATLLLLSDNHALLAGYHPQEKKWLYLNSNRLSQSALVDSPEEMAALVKQGFFNSDKVIFSTILYGLEKTRASLTRCSTKWRKDEDWEKIHTISAEKTTWRDANNSSWLHMAAQTGIMNEVQELLTLSESDINASTLRGATPLYMAAYKGLTEIMTLLISKKADANAKNIMGNTSLSVATLMGHIEAVRILLDTDDIELNPLPTETNNSNPLHIAIQNGFEEIVQMLVNKQGLDFNVATTEGFRALHLAANKGNVELVNILLEAVKDKLIETHTENGLTPLHLAAQHGHHKALESLVASKRFLINDPAEGMDDATPLHLAVLFNQIDAVDVLLNAENVDVNKLTKERATALHIAAENGCIEIVKKLLLIRAIDVFARTKNDETAAEIAQQKVYSEIAALIKIREQEEAIRKPTKHHVGFFNNAQIDAQTSQPSSFQPC